MNGQPPPAPPPGPPAGPTGFDIPAIREQLARDARVQANLGQDVLVVTENEVRLRLLQFESAVKARVEWQAPAALALGFLANLLTLKGATNFGTLVGLNRDHWMAINGTACALFGALGIYKGVRALLALKGNTVADVVSDLRPPPAHP